MRDAQNHWISERKLNWLQDPNEINGDTLNNVRREASRHFRNKKKEYLKDKINELEMNSKNKNIRDLYRGISDENRDLFSDSSNIVNRWKCYFSQLLNIYNVSDVRQIEIHSAESLVPVPNNLKVEIAIAKLTKYKSPDSDQIPAELIQTECETLVLVIHKLINSIWNKEEMPDQWKESIIVPVSKKGDKTNCNNYRGISLLSTSYNILSIIVLSRLSPYINEIIGDHQCGFQNNTSATH
jgi:hypothetical protein